ARGAVFFAPAMHHRMWAHPAMQQNATLLRERGATFLGPVTGPLANGEIGAGRMMEPLDIVDALEDHGSRGDDLTGARILVTAGPTHEDLDPVRFLGNRSSGTMGYAIAAQALRRGAQVTLVAGPVHLPDPEGADVVHVRSAREMHEAVMTRFAETDVVVMAAAVADYRPTEAAPQKIKKGGKLTLELVRNPDILADVGASRTHHPAVLVGFALETQDLAAAARGKLEKKQADLIVANAARDGLGGPTNRATLVDSTSATPLPEMSKAALANQILDRVRALLGSHPPAHAASAEQETDHNAPN
ncbi:MAG: bifunctional phosphopantothenoylcysteine decarboxylase/phosphopantothenate--cysteine ligase CoaBC, partial [Polyangiales bacterium]